MYFSIFNKIFEINKILIKYFLLQDRIYPTQNLSFGNNTDLGEKIKLHKEM